MFRYLRGESHNNIGKAFDISSFSTVNRIIERLKDRMHDDRELSRKVEQVREFLMRQGQT